MLKRSRRAEYISMVMRGFRAVGFRSAMVVVALLVVGVRLLARATVPDLDLTVGPETRLLVFAPHPDDEALGAAGLIRRVVNAGGAVRVALMTSGDAFSEGVQREEHVQSPGPRNYRTYGNLRERETVAAMQSLGVDRAHILFLGFPDGGLCLIASKYLSARGAFRSPYTGRVAPMAPEQILRGVGYRGTDIRRELESIMNSYRPTIVAFPYQDDLHPDHCATSIFVRDALDTVTAESPRFTPRALQYVVHADAWPTVDAPGAALRPPATSATADWHSLHLSADEATAKARALENYGSQLLVLRRLLRSFERPNELFVEGRPTSTPTCWCDESTIATDAPIVPNSPRPSTPRP